jgi:hypothetical protein
MGVIFPSFRSRSKGIVWLKSSSLLRPWLIVRMLRIQVSWPQIGCMKLADMGKLVRHCRSLLPNRRICLAFSPLRRATRRLEEQYNPFPT